MTTWNVAISFISGELIAIEVKRYKHVHSKNLRGLKEFQKDYPPARCYLFYVGSTPLYRRRYGTSNRADTTESEAIITPLIGYRIYCLQGCIAVYFSQYFRKKKSSFSELPRISNSL